MKETKLLSKAMISRSKNIQGVFKGFPGVQGIAGDPAYQAISRRKIKDKLSIRKWLKKTSQDDFR